MTLKEIANLAGVSVSTVSRVINNNNSKAASKEVQDTIWRIVRETNYTPNTAARNLKLNRDPDGFSAPVKTIGCIFARSNSTTDDPFFSKRARSIEQEVYRQGYIMKYSFSAYDINDAATYQVITNNRVNGIAVLGRFDKDLLEFIKKQYKHVVYVGLNKIDTEFDQIVSDGYQASMAAIQYLHKLGHSSIAYVGEKQKELRYQGYLDAMKDLKLPVLREHIIAAPMSPEGGYNGVRAFLQKQQEKTVTALFCANDSTAIGAMKAIKDCGFSVPQDFSIISIDDIDTAQYMSPMLTTIRIPMEELGKMAAKILIDRIENGKGIHATIELPFQIITRESCCKLSRIRRGIGT